MPRAKSNARSLPGGRRDRVALLLTAVATLAAAVGAVTVVAPGAADGGDDLAAYHAVDDQQRIDTGGTVGSAATQESVIEFVSCDEVRIRGDHDLVEVDASGYTSTGGLDTEILSPDLSEGWNTVSLSDAGLPADRWSIVSVAVGMDDAGEFEHLREHPNKEQCDQQARDAATGDGDDAAATDGASENVGESHTLEVVPGDGDATYRVEVTGELSPGDVNGRELNSDDTISGDGSTAEGQVASGFQGDSYRYTGELVDVTVVEGDAQFSVDGASPARASELGDEGPTGDEPAPDGGTDGSAQNAATDDSNSDDGSDAAEQHDLELVPASEDAAYRIEVTGELNPGDVNGRELNSDDTISGDGTTAEGKVASGFQGDSYQYTGELVEVTLVEGDLEVRRDGETVDEGVVTR